MTIAFAPFNAIMLLLTGVAAGLVEGVIAATTPTGLPISSAMAGVLMMPARLM